MTPFRVRSLRSQLALIGAAAVLVPLLALLAVVTVTSNDEEDIGVTDGDPPSARESRSGDGVPVVVPGAAGLLAIGALGAVWWWAGKAVAPMERITTVAREIQAGSLDRRIGLSGAAAEVQALADSFDNMLDRLAAASTTQQQLIEDASHELRTPLAALAVNNEVVLRATDPTRDEYRESAERTEALIARLQTTVDELLADARSRNRSARQVDNDLVEIVRRVVAEHRTGPKAAEVVVRGPATMRLGIDGPSVHRAIANLLDNAARYSPEGQPVEIDIEAGDPVRLSVTDHGPGIPDADLPHVFDRYHASPDGGAGIGLSLVKQVADAHGRIDVLSPLPGTGHGTRFTITFGRTAP